MLLTLNGGYILWVRQVALDRHFDIVEDREGDGCEDIVRLALFEEDGRVRRVLASGERGHETRRVVLSIRMLHDECLPSGDVRHEKREERCEARPDHNEVRVWQDGPSWCATHSLISFGDEGHYQERGTGRIIMKPRHAHRPRRSEGLLEK